MLLPKADAKSNNLINSIVNIATTAFDFIKGIYVANAPVASKPEDKDLANDKLKNQYENALKSRKGNATQWTLKDGTKCFFAVDANGRVLDYGSIWFTTKDGSTFKIAKTQCVNYKGVSKSSSDIGASLGNPKYSKLVGLDVVKAFSPMASIKLSR